MTREQLSEKSGVSVTFLSEIELGVKGFTTDIMLKLCDALHMSADKIIYDKDKLTDVQQITEILETVDEKYIPLVKENLLTFLKIISIK